MWNQWYRNSQWNQVNINMSLQWEFVEGRWKHSRNYLISGKSSSSHLSWNACFHIQLAIVFLATRVKEPIEGCLWISWKPLSMIFRCCICSPQGTQEPQGCSNEWGDYFFFNKTRRWTESKFIGVDNTLSKTLWTKLFIEAQDHALNMNLI